MLTGTVGKQLRCSWLQHQVCTQKLIACAGCKGSLGRTVVGPWCSAACVLTCAADGLVKLCKVKTQLAATHLQMQVRKLQARQKQSTKT